jgi:hypothetical protein
MRSLSLGRIVLGSGLVLSPRRWAGGWIGGDARHPGTGVLARAVGARDVGLGVGTFVAMCNGDPVRPWVLASMAADGTDLVATAVAREHLPKLGRTLIYAMAGGAYLVGAAVSGSVDDPAHAQA